MIFDGQRGYFVTPINRYNLSLYPPLDFTDYDFTMSSRVKIDYESMNPNDHTRECGIIIKNGQHLGISVFRMQGEDGVKRLYVKGQAWYLDEDKNPQFIDIVHDITTVQDYTVDLTFVHDAKMKTIQLYVNDDISLRKRYEGNLVDYKNSWLWIGCSNALSSCAEEHKQYFYGDIDFTAIFGKSLSKKEVQALYENKKNFTDEFKPILVCDYKNTTEYKIEDVSGNGNHPLIHNNLWMDE